MKYSLKSSRLEKISIFGLIVMVLVLPIITVGGFNIVDQNYPPYTTEVLGVNDSIYEAIDPINDNAESITLISIDGKEFNINNWGRKALILIFVTFVGIITFSLVTLITQMNRRKQLS